MQKIAAIPPILVAILDAGGVLAQEAADAVAPEAGTETEGFAGLSQAARDALAAKAAGTPVTAQDWMVAAANPLAVEATEAADLEQALQELGFETSVTELNSGLHAIAIGQDGLSGGADPRREGIALGE